MKKLIELDKDDIIQALADHFNVNRSKISLKITFKTEGYGPNEHQVPEVNVIVQEG